MSIGNTNPPQGSPPLSLAGLDYRKLAKSLALAMAGGALAAAAEWTELTDLGAFAPIVGGLIAFGINALRKFSTDTRTLEQRRFR